MKTRPVLSLIALGLLGADAAGQGLQPPSDSFADLANLTQLQTGGASSAAPSQRVVVGLVRDSSEIPSVADASRSASTSGVVAGNVTQTLSSPGQFVQDIRAGGVDKAAATPLQATLH